MPPINGKLFYLHAPSNTHGEPKTKTMKRLCSIAAVAMIAVGVNAQQVGKAQLPSYDQPMRDRTVQRPAQHLPVYQASQRDQLFSEDFANGLAGNNNVGPWTVIGDANGNVWRTTMTGPMGAFSNPVSERITSPSAANGFAIFDIDSVNTDYSVTPAVGMTTRVTPTGSLVSPLLDLSGPAGVEVRYTEQYRLNGTSASDHTLDVSTDNGTTWTSFDIDGATESQSTYSTAERAVNITSAITADPSNVLIRFTQGGEHNAYYWQIDDISVNSLPPNELIMDYGYTAQFGGGYEYGRVPQSLMPNTINVGAGITNYGGNAQTNVTVNVSLKDAANNEVGSSSISLGSMNNAETLIADAEMTVPSPMPLGLYTAYFTITSDSIAEDAIPSNNTKTRYLEVTSDLYSLDGIGVLPAADLSLSDAGSGTYTDNTQDVRLLNYFEVPVQTTFYGMEVYLSNLSGVGGYFIAAVYDTADAFSQTPLTSPLVESDPRIITTQDMSVRRTSVSFNQPLTLAPGAYYASANLYQEGGVDIRILDDITVPQPNVASILFLPITANGPKVYSDGTAWAVRITTQEGVGVQENPSLTGITMYPSPTSGPLEVRADIPGKMSVEVFNALGKKVMDSSFTGTATTLNLAGNAAGMYTVRIGDGTNFNLQRIVLK